MSPNLKMKRFLFIPLLMAILSSCHNSWTENSKEGASVTYHMTDKTDKICEVGTGNPEVPAIDPNYQGTVTLPTSSDDYLVEAIGEGAFRGCKKLQEVVIPPTVTSIEKGAFEGCEQLRSMVIPSRVAHIADGIFRGCKNLQSVTIRCRMNRIADHMFYDCQKMTRVDFPKGVTAIGDYAFYGCNSLTEVVIPKGVTTIGIEAFQDCRNLTSVTIPEGVTAIGEGAFSGCANLQSIHIPASVKSIGQTAFSGCTGLTSITVDPANPVYDSRNACDALIEKESNTLLVGCRKSKLPSTLTAIADRAFYGVDGLTSVSFPKGMLSIGERAFANCHDLRSVYFPSSLTSIGECPFAGCPSLTSISIHSENPIYDSHHDCNAIIETLTNTLLYGCKNSTIPPVVKKIGKGAFAGCRGLTSIRLHEGIISIGEDAFRDCPDLKNVAIPSTMTQIGENAFKGCRQLSVVEVRARKPLTIFDNTFSDCGAPKLFVPKGAQRQYESAGYWSDFSSIEEH